MNYYQQVKNSRKAQLKAMSDTNLYDIAYSYFDLEHGQGHYSRQTLINMILNQELKSN